MRDAYLFWGQCGQYWGRWSISTKRFREINLKLGTVKPVWNDHPCNRAEPLSDQNMEVLWSKQLLGTQCLHTVAHVVVS